MTIYRNIERHSMNLLIRILPPWWRIVGQIPHRHLFVFAFLLFYALIGGTEEPLAQQLSETLYRWTKVTMTAPFAPRDGAGALVYKERMWLIGGWNSRNELYFLDCVNDVWSSADGASWKLERSNTFGTPAFDPDRNGKAATRPVTPSIETAWIVGGDPIQGHYQNDVWNPPTASTDPCQ